MYRPVMNVDVKTGEAEEDVVWIPFHSTDEPVIVPDVLEDRQPRVRRLPTVKAYGPNLVCEQYAWISSWRVFTAQKVFVLGPDDQLAEVLAQVGGRPFFQMDVMQMVGDLIATDDGPAYRTIPCFRSRLPADDDLRPAIPPGNAIGWLVFHPDERAPRLDVDWLRPGDAAGWCATPGLTVRLDQAIEGGGDNLYAPVVDAAGSSVGYHVMSRALTTGSTALTPATPAPGAVAASAVTVLPEAPRRRRLFGSR